MVARALPLTIAVLLVACQESGPVPPSSSPAAASCAATISAGGVATATVTVLPHPIGGGTVFGMDGAFLATAYGFPLGANTHWTHIDASGVIGTRFDWPISSQVLQSPDGEHLVYVGADTIPPSRQLVVRGTAAGPARALGAGDRNAFRWADAYHVLVDPIAEHGAIHALDIRDGSDVVLFRPPAAPVANPAGPAWDGWELSGDLRWAVLTQLTVDPVTAAGTVIGHWLYDRTTAKYVGALDQPSLYLAPVGDLAVWTDGPTVRAMHLCDRRVATLGSIPVADWQGGTWSPDGRYFSLYSGMTDEDHGPASLLVVDTTLGQVAQVAQPWGFIQKWSPDSQYVVLGRRGYHDIVARLATLTLAPRGRP